VKLVAITACPTGIAHTYMAAEALEEEARKRGHEIHVETQGSGGADVLSAADIQGAQALIIAADTSVSGRERFAGMPTVETTPGEAINRAGQVLDRAETAADEGAVAPEGAAAAGGATAVTDTAGGGAGATAGGGGPGRSSKGGNVRQWLMTGVSYMIPFVTAGGILIALSFVFGDTLTVTESNVYEEFSIPALFIEIGSTAFSMLVPILAGFIAYAMADRPGITPGVVGGLLAVEIEAGFLGGLVAGLVAGGFLIWFKKLPWPKQLRALLPVLVWPLVTTLVVGTLMIVVIGEPIAVVQRAMENWLQGLSGANIVFLGIIVGAMMAFDMGGPVNKVAYTFAIGAVSAGILEPMAAVMAAGMTPPLGLALATVLRKRLFDEQEQEAGKAAWVMGASFITEGAIPFAAADPLRVIPALIIGSATAGALSTVFGNAVQAPHGGIFIIGIVDNWPLYLLAIAIGTVVTALLVIVLKSMGSRAASPEASEVVNA
jgi:PTS system fructose-specific IIC component